MGCWLFESCSLCSLPSVMEEGGEIGGGGTARVCTGERVSTLCTAREGW